MSLTTALVAAADDPEDLGGLAGWVVDLMEKIGPAGAGAAIALENLFPPMPSEVILPLAGFTASRGEFSLAEALLWTTAGSVLGAVVLYWVGRAFGRRRMYWLWDHLPLTKTSDLERTEAWFGRHGRKAVFLGRMVPIFRSLISVPAGVERMPFALFLALTTAGSAIWNTTFVLAGYWLGESWHRVEPVVGVLQWTVIGAVALAVCVFVLVRLRTVFRERRTAPPGTGD
jgi:membrane protein DedA with SNARE-associated domain